MRKLILIVGFLVLFNLVSSASYPHGFEGSVLIDDHTNPEGYTIVAYLDGFASGSGVISQGKYSLVVEDGSYPYGGEIVFKIGDKVASETFPFTVFEITKLNLTFDELPTEEVDLLSDGFCDISRGECSKSLIDCSIILCSGNSVCDVFVGENCATSPLDCGCQTGYSCVNTACVEVQTTSTSGGSGGGGGGGGGSTIVLQSSNSTSEISNNSEPTNSELIGINDLNNQENGNSPITGAVIGFTKSRIGLGLTFAVIVILIGFAIIYKRK